MAPSSRRRPRAATPRATAGGATGAAAALPAEFTPQLAVSVDAPPVGDDWLHEIKLDGYRVGCRIDHGAARLLVRRGGDWTDRFPEIRAAAERLPVTTALLDGEACVVGADGRTRFQGLQDALAGRARGGLTYFVFDLLHLDGEDVARLPIEERKRRLAALLGRAPPGLPLRFVDHVAGAGPAVFAEARALGLEGIVSKRAGQPAEPGRHPSWVKVKCFLRQELVVGGFTERKGATGMVGALLCGHYDDDGDLRFAGKVGTGFTDAITRDLRRRLDPLRVAACPFTPPPEALWRRGAIYVRPELVAEIAFANWTADGRIRHSSFLGLRDDKAARDVRREDDGSPSVRRR